MLPRADIAYHHFTCIDSKAERNEQILRLSPLVLQNGKSHFPCSANRTQYVVVLAKGRIKDGHKFITPESGNRASLVPDFFNHDIKIGIEQIDHFTGSHSF